MVSWLYWMDTTWHQVMCRYSIIWLLRYRHTGLYQLYRHEGMEREYYPIIQHMYSYRLKVLQQIVTTAGNHLVMFTYGKTAPQVAGRKASANGIWTMPKCHDEKKRQLTRCSLKSTESWYYNFAIHILLTISPGNVLYCDSSHLYDWLGITASIHDLAWKRASTATISHSHQLYRSIISLVVKLHPKLSNK